MDKLNSLSNRELYDLCCRNDEAAWTYLYNYILCITRWPKWNLGHQGEDIAQSVVLTLINKGLQTLKDKGAFRSFVKRITVNRILDHYKGKKGVPISSQGDVMDKKGENPIRPIASPERSQDKRVHSKQTIELILKILKDLPQYCRRVIKTYMAYHTGQLRSYQEMAESLNLTVSTVGVQIKRCKSMIIKDSRFGGLLD